MSQMLLRQGKSGQGFSLFYGIKADWMEVAIDPDNTGDSYPAIDIRYPLKQWLLVRPIFSEINRLELLPEVYRVQMGPLIYVAVVFKLTPLQDLELAHPIVEDQHWPAFLQAAQAEVVEVLMSGDSYFPPSPAFNLFLRHFKRYGCVRVRIVANRIPDDSDREVLWQSTVVRMANHLPGTQ